jgi:hypothetical protein
MDFAAVEDVETIWGHALVDPDRARVVARIAQASAVIREADPLVGGLSIDERIALSASFGSVVRGVVVDMVHRLLMNPQARLEVSVDDARVRYDASVSTGQLYLSDAEWRVLFGGHRRAGGRAFMVTPRGGPAIPSWS